MVFLVDHWMDITYNHSMIRKTNKEQNMSNNKQLSYVVYRTDNSAIVEEVRYKSTHKTQSAAKASMTRINKARVVDVLKDKGQKRWTQPRYAYLGNAELAVADIETYTNEIEQQVERTNLMSGKKYKESINTPISCSPASETYWSM